MMSGDVRKVEKESEISRACAEVSVSLERLNKYTEEIGVKFAPVLKGDLPGVEESQRLSEFTTELGTVIHNFSERVESINYKIEGIIRRCEL